METLRNIPGEHLSKCKAVENGTVNSKKVEPLRSVSTLLNFLSTVNLKPSRVADTIPAVVLSKYVIILI